jgi:hypothetical protein
MLSGKGHGETDQLVHDSERVDLKYNRLPSVIYHLTVGFTFLNKDLKLDSLDQTINCDRK